MQEQLQGKPVQFIRNYIKQLCPNVFQKQVKLYYNNEQYQLATSLSSASLSSAASIKSQHQHHENNNNNNNNNHNNNGNGNGKRISSTKKKMIKTFSKLRKDELIEFYLKLRSIRKIQRWYLKLKIRDQTCMITLDPVEIPFWRKKVSLQNYHYYNLKPFVDYMFSTGKFEDPITHEKLSDQDLKEIDQKQSQYFNVTMTQNFLACRSVYYAKKKGTSYFGKLKENQQKIYWLTEDMRVEGQQCSDKYYEYINTKSYLEHYHILKVQHLNEINQILIELNMLSNDSCIQSLKGLRLMFFNLKPNSYKSCSIKDKLIAFVDNAILSYGQDDLKAVEILNSLKAYCNQNIFEKLQCQCEYYEKKEKEDEEKRAAKRLTKRKRLNSIQGDDNFNFSNSSTSSNNSSSLLDLERLGRRPRRSPRLRQYSAIFQDDNDNNNDQHEHGHGHEPNNSTTTTTTTTTVINNSNSNQTSTSSREYDFFIDALIETLPLNEMPEYAELSRDELRELIIEQGFFF